MPPDNFNKLMTVNQPTQVKIFVISYLILLVHFLSNHLKKYVMQYILATEFYPNFCPSLDNISNRKQKSM